MKQKILVYDSGNGGTDIFNKLKVAFPKEEFLLFKDEKNAPYGNKTKKQLLNIVTTNFDDIFKNYSIKIVILACNTISACMFKELCAKYANMHIIPITPNVPKDNLPCLILSTAKTKKSSLVLKELKVTQNAKCKMQNYCELKPYYMVGYKTLAKKIDDNLKMHSLKPIVNSNDNSNIIDHSNLDALLPFLKQTLNRYKKHNIQSISLACTHFPYIKKQLLYIFPEVVFYDNSNILITQLQRVLTNL